MSVCLGWSFRWVFPEVFLPVRVFSSGFFPGGRGPRPPKFLVLGFCWPPALFCFVLEYGGSVYVYIVSFDDLWCAQQALSISFLLLVLMTYGVHSRPYHTGDVFSGWGRHATVHVLGGTKTFSWLSTCMCSAVRSEHSTKPTHPSYGYDALHVTNLTRLPPAFFTTCEKKLGVETGNEAKLHYREPHYTPNPSLATLHTHTAQLQLTTAFARTPQMPASRENGRSLRGHFPKDN